MEELVAVIFALLHWRLVLSVTGAVAITLTLSHWFAGFTAGYCISFVILAAVFGIYWQSRSEAGVGIATQMPGPKISKPIAFLGLSFVGLIWGGLATELLKSELLAIASLALSVACVGVWYGIVLRQLFTLRQLAFSASALLSGFVALMIFVHLAAT